MDESPIHELDEGTLPRVKANGFTVYADAAVIAADGTVHLLGLIGRRQAAEAVAATLLGGKTALLFPDPRAVGDTLRAPAEGGYKQFARRLSGGGHHLTLLPERADYTRAGADGFTLIAPAGSAADGNGDEVARLHYLFLSRCVSTPLDDHWQGWLWRRARAVDAMPLRVIGRCGPAWCCAPDEAALRRDILAALSGDRRYGHLPVPERVGDHEYPGYRKGDAA